MLEVTVPKLEMYDENKNEFVTSEEVTLVMEHSLLSISKWESVWHKPFLSKDAKTEEELFDYIRCMTLTQNVNPVIYKNLPKVVIDKIIAYIDDPMTATWFGNNADTNRKSSRVVTSELIYYWMVAFNIPFECQKWHLNRLMTLIRICGIENAPKKQMSRSDILSRNRALNQARRKAHRTKG